MWKLKEGGKPIRLAGFPPSLSLQQTQCFSIGDGKILDVPQSFNQTSYNRLIFRGIV
ncbi:hypothetical protein Cabys_194 [Caldithrix abyssi DSM 13497]|uniref:Uncharacterized protein n=1 Tax=Caldithrix abyssi DSM 13497 TaxID=880073 RepID=A0A1J1C3R9_CALAY|nr:hypothetical protein Cabys_194 [Caldithrix abyssi DSM 13497]